MLPCCFDSISSDRFKVIGNCLVMGLCIPPICSSRLGLWNIDHLDHSYQSWSMRRLSYLWEEIWSWPEAKIRKSSHWPTLIRMIQVVNISKSEPGRANWRYTKAHHKTITNHFKTVWTNTIKTTRQHSKNSMSCAFAETVSTFSLLTQKQSPEIYRNSRPMSSIWKTYTKRNCAKRL
jgi:hypothetical protein